MDSSPIILGEIVYSGFKIQRSDNDYLLTISFTDSAGKASGIALKIFQIEKISDANIDFSYYTSLIENNSISYCCDVQPINGTQNKKFLKNLIKKSHVSDISNQLEFLNNNYSSSQKINLFVLDIKDTDLCYENTQEIEIAEEMVAQFLRNAKPEENSPRRLFHDIIRDNYISFFIREGRLKSHLIKHFSKEQADFLQNKSEGRERLCQICEVIMNFFKMGYMIESEDNSFGFHPNDYFFRTFESLCLQSSEFSLSKTHSLKLLTVYPSYYKNLYSKQEEYFNSLSNIFQMEHNYDESTGTTAIII